MRSINLLAAFTFGITLSTTSAAAASGGEVSVSPPVKTGADYCGVMQQFIAGTPLVADIRHYNPDDYDEGFKKSKPTVQPLVTHQYVGFQTPGGATQEIPVTVSCKLKTAERIRHAHTTSELEVAASEDRTCQQWTEALLDVTYASLERAMEEGPAEGDSMVEKGGLLPREQIKLDDEKNAYIGPLWVNPFPYQVAYQNGEYLHLRSKALHAEYSRWMPLPDSFMGTHYCHAIAPEYLQALIRRDLVAPELE
ncbi:hypothetical protein [Microbulbifer sp. ALW1]|uniref:hypothetical protein n=1 Tax=Microbulbifer sp. (strain ALW1) TaxID=1516059 RepID=UPI00135A4118|nr:hypothetical protein [Microbulbifer sp. ALW1]